MGSTAKAQPIAKPATFFKSHRRRNILLLSTILLAIIGTSVVVAQMIDASTMKMHVHPRLSVTINGQPFAVPTNLGTPQGPWLDHSLDHFGVTGMSPLHTHDASGMIHVESNKIRDFTLREFLAIWGKQLDASQVPGHQVDPGHRATMIVDGVERTVTDDVVFANGQQIQITCGP